MQPSFLTGSVLEEDFDSKIYYYTKMAKFFQNKQNYFQCSLFDECRAYIWEKVPINA